MKTIVYYLGISFFFTHEMDAVINMEWRLLYHLRTLPDVSSSAYFIALHLPLFFAFFYFGHHRNSKLKNGFRCMAAAFLVIHAALHFRLSDHELYAFSGIASNIYIYVSAIFGLLFLLLTIRDRGTSLA